MKTIQDKIIVEIQDRKYKVLHETEITSIKECNQKQQITLLQYSLQGLPIYYSPDSGVNWFYNLLNYFDLEQRHYRVLNEIKPEKIEVYGLLYKNRDGSVEPFVKIDKQEYFAMVRQLDRNKIIKEFIQEIEI